MLRWIGATVDGGGAVIIWLVERVWAEFILGGGEGSGGKRLVVSGVGLGLFGRGGTRKCFVTACYEVLWEVRCRDGDGFSVRKSLCLLRAIL